VSLWGSRQEEGRTERRGLATGFVIAGAVLAYWWNVYAADFPRLFMGLASIAVGIGLFATWRWARWLALGVCFLAVVMAFAMPVMLALWRPFDSYEGAARQMELFTCVSIAAIGVIGHKGLAYFRSAAAWRAFSTTEVERLKLAEESSLTVVISAFCLAFLLSVFAGARGVGLPSLPSLSSTPKSAEKLPDLVINSVCMSGENLVEAEVQNRGTGTDPGEYLISFTDTRGRGGMDSSKGMVPAPGQSTYVVLNNAINQSELNDVRVTVTLDLDSTHKIRESNESNNSSRFDIVFRYFYPGNLPPCP